ncbi:MAG: hypothetical protein JRF37_07815 [Deltaproteobacteria bacterium]|nr:hypothetical protein [Deltaproteobacteria bacterium]
MNNSGQAVGTSMQQVGPNNMSSRPILWDDTGLHVIAPQTGNARDINESGQVVGDYHDPATGDRKMFLWDSTNGMQHLEDLLPPGSAWNPEGGINNDNGQFAGYGYLSGETTPKLFFFDPIEGIQDLGYGTEFGTVRAMNNLGVVVGVDVVYDPIAGRHVKISFIWDSALGWRDLVTLYSGDGTVVAVDVRDINDLGQAVGQLNSSHAFLLDQGNIIDLNDLLPGGTDWIKLTNSFGINNKMQIVGKQRGQVYG